MKNSISYILLLTVLVFWSSCREDFEFRSSTGDLSFSRDTVYLDTVFSNIGSSTYNLKVYNNSSEDIVIPTLGLRQGETSNYRINVDGRAGKVFEDVELLARDSLFIFIETTIDINDLVVDEKQFLYTDVLEFDSGENLQTVELITLVKDAIFIFPQQSEDPETGQLVRETLVFDIDGDGVDDESVIEGRFLEDSELTFTNDKPYVIYGYAAVGGGKTLTVEAGARLHFHANSGLLITDGASINVNGSLSDNSDLLENEVVFEGDRLEPEFSEVPGQWGTIWLFPGSRANTFNYATVKNASIGILCEGDQNDDVEKLTIRNSQIYNSGSYGLLGRATSIKGENLVVNNSGQSSFAGVVGGRYNFTHSTLANYWQGGPRELPSVLLNNFVEDLDGNITTNDLVEANFNNCIIYGNENPELILDEANGAAFNFKFTNCLIRFQDSNNFFSSENYDFDNIELYEQVVFNREPSFKDPFNNALIIGDDSAANGLGNLGFANEVPLDILNVNRMLSPDLGAYQHITFEED